MYIYNGHILRAILENLIIRTVARIFLNLACTHTYAVCTLHLSAVCHQDRYTHSLQDCSHNKQSEDKSFSVPKQPQHIHQHLMRSYCNYCYTIIIIIWPATDSLERTTAYHCKKYHLQLRYSQKGSHRNTHHLYCCMFECTPVGRFDIHLCLCKRICDYKYIST